MPDDHDTRAQPFGPRGSNIVLPDHLQHAGPGEAGDDAGIGKAQRDGGYQDLGRFAPADLIVEGTVGPDIEQLARDKDKERGDHEAGHAVADDGGRARHIVDPGVLFERGEQPQRQADADREDQGGRAQLPKKQGRDLDPPVDQRFAQVAVQDAGDPQLVLLRQRQVEVEVMEQQGELAGVMRPLRDERIPGEEGMLTDEDDG